MGDRCYLNVRCRKEHKERLLEILKETNDEFIDEDDTTITFAICEADIGHVFSRTLAAAEGIPFVGYHAAGYEYGGNAFASTSGHMQECPIDKEGDLYVRVNNVGTINDGDLVEVREFVDFRRHAVKALEAK